MCSCIAHTYLNSRCVLNLNGQLFSVYLQFSGVQVACNAKKCRINTFDNITNEIKLCLLNQLSLKDEELTDVSLVVTNKPLSEETNHQSCTEEARNGH